MSVIFLISVTTTLYCHAELPRESILFGSDFDNLSVSAGYSHVKRNMHDRSNESVEGTFKADLGYLILTYDFSPWLSVGAGVGQSEALPQSGGGIAGKENDGKEMWTFGLQANLWQGDIYEPDYLTSRCRIQSSASFWTHDSTVYGTSVNWDELRADLLFSVESFVTGLGEDTTESPYSLIVYGGLVYSKLYLDSAISLTSSARTAETKYGQDQSTGFAAGLVLKLHNNLWLGWEARIFEEVTQSASLTYHF